MTTKTPQQAKEARQKLGFTSSQMAEASGLNNGSMIRKFEQGQTKVGRTTSFLMDVLTGDIDPSDVENNDAYQKAMDGLDGPTRTLINLITGDVDLKDHLDQIRAKRVRKKIQKDVD